MNISFSDPHSDEAGSIQWELSHRRRGRSRKKKKALFSFGELVDPKQFRERLISKIAEELPLLLSSSSSSVESFSEDELL